MSAEEIWVPLFNGKYSVSSLGNVISNARIDSLGRHQGGFIMKQTLLKAGYMNVALRIGDKQVNYRVHRLVAMAFIPNTGNKPTVNHKNSIRTDNRVENLEWATWSENNKHAFAYGNQKRTFGESHNQAKLKEPQVEAIRAKYVKGKYTMKMLSGEYGVSKGAIQAILNYKSWNTKAA